MGAASKISWTEDLTFNDWYPGNEYVDIIGFDRYSKESEYKFNMLADCRVAVNHSKTLGKIVGLAETGISDGIQDVTSSKWFMKEFLEVITQDDLCHHLSYALTFANQPTHEGFLEMYRSNSSIFAGDNRWNELIAGYGFGPSTVWTTTGGSQSQTSVTAPPASAGGQSTTAGKDSSSSSSESSTDTDGSTITSSSSSSAAVSS